MNVEQIIQSLHPLERQVLLVLNSVSSLEEVSKKTGLEEIQVMRAFQWLQNKNIVTLKEELKELIELDTNGKRYATTGLPERIFLNNASAPIGMSDLLKKSQMSNDELQGCIGVLRSKGAIVISKEKELIFTLSEQGKKLLKGQFPEESILTKQFPLELGALSKEEKESVELLKKRKSILTQSLSKKRFAYLTELGKSILKSGIEHDEIIDTLTPAIIKSKEWKGKNFRRYDITSNVPSIHAGKRHFVNQAIEYARRIWLDMGFKEMQGPLINTSLWNFDALFVAQDHPVREMQDTYFVKDPSSGKLPNPKIVEAIKAAHEHGAGTGSKGWNYSWSESEAKKLVLRTHTTVLSAKTIATLKESDLPVKFFSFGKCFRNETVDWSHLCEFHQTEGIVIDPNANFTHLLGYLKQFFAKMGFPKARFRPAYFPYTEPSVEIDVFHQGHQKWIELGGAGIFRPEVVVPLLGKNVPILAWGPGFDRLIMDYYKIKDLRDLYRNDLKQVREMKTWLD